jgi:hypothetical protein
MQSLKKSKLKHGSHGAVSPRGTYVNECATLKLTQAVEMAQESNENTGATPHSPSEQTDAHCI